LRPDALLDQCGLDAGGFGRTGLQVSEAVADDCRYPRADRFGPCGIAGGALLNDALDHRASEGDAAGLDRLKVARGKKMDLVPAPFRLDHNGVDGRKGFSRGRTDMGDGVGKLKEVTHRRHRLRGDVDQFSRSNRHQARPLDIGAPRTSDERAVFIGSGHFHPSPLLALAFPFRFCSRTASL
jgi:hypothetical protein